MTEELPPGWCERCLADVGLPSTPNVNPQAHKSETFELYSVPSFEFGTPETVQGVQIASTRQAVEPDDVLLCKINPRINRVWVVGSKGTHRQIASTEWVVVRTRAADPRFLMWQMRSEAFRERLLDDVSGVGGSLMRARSAGIGKLLVRLAPLAEQRRIVARIEALFARTRQARNDLQRIAPLAAHYQRQLLSTAIANEGAAPRRVGEIGRVITGTTPPTKEPGHYGGEIAFMKPTDLDAGYQVEVAREHLTARGAAISRLLPAGSTLVTCIGATIGKTGFARVACATNQQINAIVPDTVQVDPRWVYWVATTPAFQDQIHANASATTLPIINKGRFEALEMPLPSLERQRAVIGSLETKVPGSTRVVADAERALALLDRLEQSILAKAFAGELVAQDPADETADALLARLSAEPRAARTRAPRAAALTAGPTSGTLTPPAAAQPPSPPVAPPAPRAPTAKPAAPSTAAPPPADEADMPAVIRALFADGLPRPRDLAMRDLARALGHQRLGARIEERMHGALIMAVRRRILENTPEGLRLLTRTIGDYTRDEVQTQFLASLQGRAWTEQEDAIRGFARWLGFQRTGPVIAEEATSTIRTLIRQGRLERDGISIRRTV